VAVTDRLAQGPLELFVERDLAPAVELDEQVNWPLRMTHELELYARPAAAYGLRP
jgi:hypothetical protein